jgi:hypothetical protein
MTTGAGSFSALAAFEASSPCLIETEGGFKHDTELKTVSVGQDRLSHSPMSDEEREQAAYRAGNAMLAWYSQFKQTGNTDDLDRAYHCMGIQKRLLAGRSPEFVAQLEKDRGLA